MYRQKMALLKEKIQDAELVLVGIGEEWKLKEDVFLSNSGYRKAVECFGENSSVISYVKNVIIEMEAEEAMTCRKKAYQELENLLKDKNYFIVTLCEDGLIMRTGLNTERLVMPCGTWSKLQCADGCHEDIYEQEQAFLEEIKKWLQKDDGESKEMILSKVPVCPKCGRELVANTIEGENYLEAGYLPKWQTYMKWLQGTVNKKLCVLELGVGMKYPSVIRWPFEKITFFNQKATHFRVHSTLYQTAEEIKEKSYGIKLTPEDFIRELSSCD